VATFEADRLPPTEELVPGPERPAPTLLVASEGRLTSHTLRPGQRLVIGRALDCDIRVDDVGVSRWHARVIVGSPIQLEDLGNANGVHYRGRTLAQGDIVPLAADEVVAFGDGRTLILVRDASAAPTAVAGRAMATAHALVERVAATELPLLFLGETGAGKQVLAEAAHRASRRPGPFVRVDAAGLSDERFDAEVLGVAGPGPGLVAQAAGGTLFLDEVAELSPHMQRRLLHLIEPQRAPSAGAPGVRFMAATNRNLRDAVAAGRFRADLLFRINGVSIVVPPLRERGDELRALADELLAAACAGRDRPAWTPGARAAMAAHDWPGNVRELAHAIERAVAVHDGGVIDAADLGLERAAGDAEPRLREELGGLEEKRIREALDHCGGNQSAAARLLGISRNTLIARIRSYGLPRPQGRTP